MTKWLVILAAALALAAAGCGSDGDDGAEDSAAGSEGVTVDLAEQNGSGETGTTTLEPAGEGMRRLVLSVEGAPANPQPAHIHSGSCAELGDVVHGLENVTDGSSETTVEASVDELTAGGFAINVHKSEDEIQTYVACGDLGGEAESDGGGDSDGGYYG
jgi:hypothetical protein